MAVLSALALSSAITLMPSPSAALSTETYVCFDGLEVPSSVAQDSTLSIVPLVLAIEVVPGSGIADDLAADDECVGPVVEIYGIDMGLVDGSGDPVPWPNIVASSRGWELLGGETVLTTIYFDEDDVETGTVQWVLTLDLTMLTATSDEEREKPFEERPGLVGVARLVFDFDVPLDADAPLGDYGVEADLMTELAGMTTGTLMTSAAFSIVAPTPTPTSETGSGPVISVTCGSEVPVVGSSVTCTVQSEPDFDFVWRASTNPEFASGVVTTDKKGTGEFTFDVPAAAVGQEVLVEIVDWTGPEPIGVASGPVPATVPAGEGHTTVPMVLSAFVVLGMAGLTLRSRAVTVTR